MSIRKCDEYDVLIFYVPINISRNAWRVLAIAAETALLSTPFLGKRVLSLIGALLSVG